MPRLYTFFLSLSLLAHHGQATASTVALGLGSNGGGYLELVDPTNDFANTGWKRLSWTGYNIANGETRPVWCDVDGDDKHELVIGLGLGGGGWLNILDDETTEHTSLAWVQIPWISYNRTNGETHPSCGDVDGDGRDELVVGLGAGGQGHFIIFEDAESSYEVQWKKVHWRSYNIANGATYPTVGNIDGDVAEEVLVGLGEGSSGWMQVLDNAHNDFAHLQWIPSTWSSYNSANGATRPTFCDVDGDEKLEVVIGLASGGRGYFQILEDADEGFSNLMWHSTNWSSYNAMNGETFPACGDIDNDGRDEIIVGLGAGGRGYYEIRDDHMAGCISLGWKRSHWTGYSNSDGGSIHPAFSSHLVAAIEGGLWGAFDWDDGYWGP